MFYLVFIDENVWPKAEIEDPALGHTFTPLIKGEKIFYLMFIDETVWPKTEVEDPALGQMSNLFGSAFCM